MTERESMKEIFKAKRTDNGEWIEGNLITFEEDAYIMELENTYIRTHYTGEDCVEFDMRAYKVDKNTICQYTGLEAYWTAFENEPQECDVWEHDLLEVNYEGKKVIANVKYEGGMFILASNEFIDSYIPLFDVVQIEDDYWIDAEVIGNIFDNQELLER